MSVGSFDPGQLNKMVGIEAARDLLGAAETTDDKVTLDRASSYAGLITQAGWAECAAALDDQEIELLIRIFTLGEMQLPGWRADDKSAVVPLVRELKSRGCFDKSLGQWIKAHTDNRFLPHGNLMDRL